MVESTSRQLDLDTLDHETIAAKHAGWQNHGR